MTTATEPTLQEQVQALKTTVHRLAAERDQIAAEKADLLESNAYLQQEANRARARVSVAIEVNTHLREELDDRNRQNRKQLNEIYRLANLCADLEKQADAAQQGEAPQEHVPLWRRLFTRWHNRT